MHIPRPKLPKRKPRTNGVVTAEAEQQKVEALKARMEDRRGAVDNNTAKYVQAAIEYGVAQTRSEYRPLANRNWRIIQKFGVRLMRTIAALTVVLLILGAVSYKTTQDIQNGRRNGVLEKCHAGEHFHQKLKQVVSQIPAGPKRVEAEANIKGTEALVATIVPIGHCEDALRRAGLSP
jgi:hypothetical protein